MLYRHQSQKFGLRSNHGNYPESVSFSFWGMCSIGNAKDFRQILQALNYRDDKPSSGKPGPGKRRGEYYYVSDLGMLRIGD